MVATAPPQGRRVCAIVNLGRVVGGGVELVGDVDYPYTAGVDRPLSK